MQFWTMEHGTLWTLALDSDLPPRYTADVEVNFDEVSLAGSDALAAAMQLSSPASLQQRLQGRRRCFVLWGGSEIICYGWVTQGAEYVGELDRKFHVRADEAYIWDCVTLPDWRGKGCYSALLSHIIYRLSSEGVSRAWIGASRRNYPSVAGFDNAGFKPVVDVTYARLYRLTLLWMHRARAADAHAVAAAVRILHSPREWRVGRLAIGYYTESAHSEGSA